MIPGRVLGIDPGDVRTGLAISDDFRMLAMPLETITASGKPLIERIRAIVLEREVKELVVGLPRNMDGSYGAAADKVRAFAKDLSHAIGDTHKIHLWDERLSTVAASKSLRESGKNSRKQKNLVDQVAAQIILQSWLDGGALCALP